MFLTNKISKWITHNTKQWPQYLAVTSATIGCFIVGVGYGWSSPSLAILQSDNTPFPVTNNEASWIASSLQFGSAFGSIIAAIVTRYIGPRKSILLSTLPFLIGCLLIVFSSNASFLIASRFFSGIGEGFTFTVIPIYAGEISEDNIRGSTMLLLTVLLVFGSIFVSCLAPYFSLFFTAWILSIFPVIMFVSFFFMPDSHYFLIKTGKEENALKSLKWFRRNSDDNVLQIEIDKIKSSLEGYKFSITSVIKQSIVNPNLTALFIVFSLLLAQHFSGNLPVGFYQEQIFNDAKIPMRPEVAVIVSQLVGIVSVFISMVLIDRWGRKPLLIISCGGCVVSTTLLGVYYQMEHVQETYPMFRWLPMVAMTLFLCFFALGLAPIPNIIMGEIFSSSYKESAICIMQIVGSLLGATVTKLFQITKDTFGTPCVFYSLSCTSFLILVMNVIIIPETSKKSLLEIQNILMGAKNVQVDKEAKPET